MIMQPSDEAKAEKAARIARQKAEKEEKIALLKRYNRSMRSNVSAIADAPQVTQCAHFNTPSGTYLYVYVLVPPTDDPTDANVGVRGVVIGRDKTWEVEGEGDTYTDALWDVVYQMY